MEIKIKIPKEFEEHFNKDRFKDSLERIYTDLEYSANYKIFGNHELETIKMLEDSLIKAEVIKIKL
mgnify:CR=1 FL=1